MPNNNTKTLGTAEWTIWIKGVPGDLGWGWAAKVTKENEEVTIGDTESGKPEQDRAALLAGLRVLDWLADQRNVGGVIIRSDAAFLTGGMEKWRTGWKAKGWKKEGGKRLGNADLWQSLDERDGEFRRKGITISWETVTKEKKDAKMAEVAGLAKRRANGEGLFEEESGE